MKLKGLHAVRQASSSAPVSLAGPTADSISPALVVCQPRRRLLPFAILYDIARTPRPEGGAGGERCCLQSAYRCRASSQGLRHSATA